MTEKDYYDIENLLNAHMNTWCNIIRANYQVRSSFQATNNAIPPEYGLRKDHKVFNVIIKGPLTRPVCGAVRLCNFSISYFFCTILKPLIALAEEACDSSEDKLYRVNQCNMNHDITDYMIGSFDAEVLYPSININRELEKQLSDHNFSLKLYARYVDDGNVAIKKITNGAGTDTNDEETTMEKVKEIGNSIHKSIVVKVDYPSNHENNRLPVLDMVFWIGQVEVNRELKQCQLIFKECGLPIRY